jgi:hypothetical protein
MKSKFLWWVLGAVGIFFLISSLIITIVEYQRFQNQSVTLPAGSTIGGVPVGGLDAAEAAAQLDAVFGQPLDLFIQDATVAVAPADLGFQMDSASLVQAALAEVSNGSYWSKLWNRAASADAVTLPLEASVDEDQLRATLTQEIEPRYTQPGTPLMPIPNTTNFSLSTIGDGIDLAQAVPAIRAALLDPDVHAVTLSVTTSSGGGLDWASLETFLKHNIAWTGYDGLVEVYLESMDSGQSLHFATWDGEDVTPDIAFTGASTIKIPIVVSIFRHLDEPTPDIVLNLMHEMIANSENAAADTLMQYYLDENLGPLMVTEDMQALGLESTFLAGYFYFDAPLLRLIDTPANTRTDIDLDPDVYNQMVVGEISDLMTGIYHCAADGSGLLTETFPGEITQSECQTMVGILSELKELQFIDTTLPPEATVADKYGYVVELDGLLHSISDAAIIYTPGGDFVLTISVYHPEWLYEYNGTEVIGRLAQTVYNFFNPNDQAYWWLD